MVCIGNKVKQILLFIFRTTLIIPLSPPPPPIKTNKPLCTFLVTKLTGFFFHENGSHIFTCNNIDIKIYNKNYIEKKNKQNPKNKILVTSENDEG